MLLPLQLQEGKDVGNSLGAAPLGHTGEQWNMAEGQVDVHLAPFKNLLQTWQPSRPFPLPACYLTLLQALLPLQER